MKKLIAAALLWAFVFPAHALTFVQMPDKTLLDQADLVLEGEILDTVPLTREAGDLTLYRVGVLDYLKGRDGAEVEVRVPGARQASSGDTLMVPGAPHFNPGDSVLLFLSRRADGNYGITQSALGAFHRQPGGVGRSIARRSLAGTYELPGTGLGMLLPAADQLRDWEGFKRWLKVTASGGDAAPTYWNSHGTGEPTTGNFTTLGTPPSRWFQFDSDQNVAQHAHGSGQTGVAGGGFGEFETGIAAWNSDAGSNIRYVYGGTTNASGGLQSGDGVNSILFNDPNSEIDGSFDCNPGGGGVLASGGFRTSGTGTFNGVVFNRISESDIVIQDNAGCFLSVNNNAAQIFAHELGHTLGLGHSCGDSGIGPLSDCTLNPAANDALMRAFPHTDGRGADLRSDDEAGAEFLYDASTSGGGNPPPAISGGGGGDSGGGGGGGAMDPALLLLLMILVLTGHGRRTLLWPLSGPARRR